MRGKVQDRNSMWMSLVVVVGLCVSMVLSAGCCTEDCCLSDKCKKATACVDPYVRTMTIVDHRQDGCPSTWSSIMVTPKDKIEITNCASQTARLVYTPAGLFNEGNKFDLPSGETLVLTVSSSVVVGQIANLVVEGDGSCSHPGSGVIVGDGP